jgi:MFS-type transporter involved in bile tolerance (Atg22 family)
VDSYWQTGFGTGPDTTMAVLWGASLVLVAATDGSCHAYNGLSSGADGQMCVPTNGWNNTFFEQVGGRQCLSKSILGDPMYTPDPSLPGCLAAFSAYRAAPEYTGAKAFTCNCTGPRTDHTFLGQGGMRPSNAFTIVNIVALSTYGVLSPFVGVLADFSDNTLKWWKVLTNLGVLCNFGMMALGANYVWVIGSVFAVLTAVFTEIQIPIRASYMELVAPDNPTRGYMGAMRQFASYSAQLVYVLVLVVPILLLSSQVSAIIAAGLCALWYLLSMNLLFLPMMRKHGARRARPEGANACVLTTTQLVDQTTRLISKYPRAALFLLAHMFAQFGGPIFITLVSTYMPAQLGVTDLIRVNLVAIVVLLVGAFAAYGFGFYLKKDKISFKLSWIIVLSLNIIIGGLVPLVAKDSSFISYVLLLVLAGGLGAVALSWFYSLGWPCFISMIPAEEVGAYNGIFSFWNAIVQPFANLIYFAVVQATNSHQLAWLLTTVPFCTISFLLMLFVDFEKASADAGRKKDAVASSTTAA